MTHKVLLISYAFPPLAAPEAILSAKLMGNLKGIECDVIATQPWKSHAQDKDLVSYVDERFGNILRLKPPWWTQFIPEHHLHKFGVVPDPMCFMTGAAINAAQKLGLENYDAIVTWSQWHSAHLAGLEIKRLKIDLPWLVHMSDPWVDNPYCNYTLKERERNIILEKQVIEHADMLLFTSAETVELVMNKYPDKWRDKAKVIPHVFDTSLYGETQMKSENDKVVVRYTGHFYGLRSPAPLLRALAEIHKTTPSVLDGVRFEIIGNIEPGMLNDEDWAGVPNGLVEMIKPVAYKRSLELMQQSDLLLIVDAPLKLSVFLPGKLVDYIGSAKPVMGITPPGASCELIKRLGGWVADPTDCNGIVKALSLALDHVKTCRNKIFGDQTVRDEFDAACVGKRKAVLIQSLFTA